MARIMQDLSRLNIVNHLDVMIKLGFTYSARIQ